MCTYARTHVRAYLRAYVRAYVRANHPDLKISIPVCIAWKLAWLNLLTKRVRIGPTHLLSMLGRRVCTAMVGTLEAGPAMVGTVTVVEHLTDVASRLWWAL